IQIDAEPRGYHQGIRTADLFVRADARLAAIAILQELESGPDMRARVRTPELATRIRTEPAYSGDWPAIPDTLDPRDVCRALEEIIPKDARIVSGTGNQSCFHTVMRGYDPRKYHCLRGFGAIGNALSHAAGIAVAADGRSETVLF